MKKEISFQIKKENSLSHVFGLTIIVIPRMSQHKTRYEFRTNFKKFPRVMKSDEFTHVVFVQSCHIGYKEGERNCSEHTKYVFKCPECISATNKVRFERKDCGPVACCVGILPVLEDGRMTTTMPAECRLYYTPNSSDMTREVELRAVIDAISRLDSSSKPPYSAPPSVLVLTPKPLINHKGDLPTDLMPVALSNLADRLTWLVFDTVVGSSVWVECRRRAYDYFEKKGSEPSVWSVCDAVAIVNTNGMYEGYDGVAVDVKQSSLQSFSQSRGSRYGKRNYSSYASDSGKQSASGVSTTEDARVAKFFDQSPASQIAPTRVIDELKCYRIPTVGYMPGKLDEINNMVKTNVLKEKFTYDEAKRLYDLYGMYWEKGDQYDTHVLHMLMLLCIRDIECIDSLLGVVRNMKIQEIQDILSCRTDINFEMYVKLFRVILGVGAAQ